MVILFFFAAHWYVSLFFQTFFHHRYAAHKMFTLSKAWEKVFFIFSFITQGASYLSPYVYGILHRMHHAYADTDKDPHSPKYDKNLFAMMWRTKIIYSKILGGNFHVEEPFKKELPEWFWFDRLADKWAARIFWMACYTAFYIYFVPSGMGWMYLLLPFHFMMGPLHGAVINWFAHKYGYVNFKIENTSKNLLPVDVLMLGEGYHNNHHKYSGRANFGIKWFELDLVYPIIRIFHKFRIIQLKV